MPPSQSKINQERIPDTQHPGLTRTKAGRKPADGNVPGRADNSGLTTSGLHLLASDLGGVSLLSAALAEALGKQDLFINTNLANMGLGLIWKMFRELKLEQHGLYMNLKTMEVNPIKITA